MAKLFVIFARDVPSAVILRRGPSQWYHVLQWDTLTDVITPGAWIKGRIYPEKCDISPDGRLLLYFVHQGSRSQSPFTHAWTAVSRTPWLSALVVWPQGTTYGGGGRFIDNRRLSLRLLYSKPIDTHPDFSLRGLEVVEGTAEPHQSSDEVAGVDWSGRDQENRLAFTRGGVLYRRTIEGDQIVADLTNLVPNPQPAPDWATRPLK